MVTRSDPTALLTVTPIGRSSDSDAVPPFTPDQSPRHIEALSRTVHYTSSSTHTTSLHLTIALAPSSSYLKLRFLTTALHRLLPYQMNFILRMKDRRVHCISLYANYSCSTQTKLPIADTHILCLLATRERCSTPSIALTALAERTFQMKNAHPPSAALDSPCCTNWVAPVSYEPYQMCTL